MHFKLILVTSFCLSAVLSSPLPNPPLKHNEPMTTELIGPTEETSEIPVGDGKEPNDLAGQETFYPVGGVWWGVRPWGGWGGWGGYRPWHGWHGWHRPHWGGHWGGGGSWGGHWGGGRWGRSSS